MKGKGETTLGTFFPDVIKMDFPGVSIAKFNIALILQVFFIILWIYFFNKQSLSADAEHC